MTTDAWGGIFEAQSGTISLTYYLAYECMHGATVLLMNVSVRRFAVPSQRKPVRSVLAAVITSSKNTMGEHESRKYRCCVGLRAQREGRRLLSPFQLMCGMGGPLWWAPLSAETNCSSWECPRSDRKLPLHQSHRLSQWRSLCPARGHTNQETQAVPLQVLINALVLDTSTVQQHKDKTHARSCSNYACAHALAGLCALSFTGSLGNVNQYWLLCLFFF